MAVYLFDTNQQLFKILPDNRLISSIQEQEITEDDSLLNDVLRVKLLADEELDKTHYMAVESHEGNSQSFDFYSIADIKTPDNTTELIGASAGPIELSGYVVEDIRPNNRDVTYVATQILKDTEWRVGYVEDGLPLITDEFYFLSAKDSLKKLQAYGCEIVFKVEISGQGITDKWIEIYKQMGERTQKRFTYGSNALTVEREVSYSGIYTALIGRGKGEETENGGFGRKITFEDVEWNVSNGDPVDKPLGQNYVELPESTAVYGIQTRNGKVAKKGIVEFSDTEDKTTLLKQTYDHLVNVARPKVQFKASVVNIGDVNIGDTVSIHRYDLGYHYSTRVFKVTRDKLDNDRTQISLGDVLVQPSTRKQSQINSTLSNITDSQTDIVEQINVISRTADGKNNINFGNNTPETARTGDLWYRDHPSKPGYKQMLIWNGTDWEIESDTSRIDEAEQAIAEQQEDLETVKQSANESAQSISDAISGSGFLDLDDMLTNMRSISEQTRIDAETAQSNAIKAIGDAETAIQNAQNARNAADNAINRADDLEETIGSEINRVTGLIDGVSDRSDEIANDLIGIGNEVTAVNQRADNAFDLIEGLDEDFQSMEFIIDRINNDLSLKLEQGDMTSYVAGEISLSESRFQMQLENALSGIDVNDRNFIIYSALEDSYKSDFWSMTGSAREISFVSDGTTHRARLTRTGEGANRSFFTSTPRALSDIGVSVGDELTFSFNQFQHEGLDSGSTTAFVRCYGASGIIADVAVHTFSNRTWGINRVVNTATIPSGTQRLAVVFAIGTVGGIIRFNRVKLQAGNVATVWSPAPEDFTSSIDSLRTYTEQQIQSTAQQFTQQLTTLRTYVDDTEDSLVRYTDNQIRQTSQEFSQQLTSINGSLSDMGSDLEDVENDLTVLRNTTEQTAEETRDEISRLEVDISNRATSTQFNELVSTVDGTVQTISDIETDLDSKASNSRVNTIEDTVDGTLQTIATLRTDVDGKASNSRVNTIEDTVEGTRQTILDVQNDLTSLENQASKNLIREDADGYVSNSGLSYVWATRLKHTDGNGVVVTATNSGGWMWLSSLATLQQGRTYTLHLTMNKGRGSGQISIGQGDGNWIHSFEVTNNTTRLNYTFEAVTSGSFGIRFHSADDYRLAVASLTISGGATTQRFNQIESTVEGTKQTIATLRTDVDGKASNSRVNTIENTVDGLNSTVMAYQVEVDEFGNEVASYATQVSNFSNTVDGLSSTVTSFQEDVDSYSIQVSNFENTVDGFRNDVSRYSSDVEGFESQVSSFENTVAGFNSSVTKIQGDYDGLSGEVSVLDAEISSMAGELSSKISQTQLQGAIDGIEIGGRNLLRNTKEEYTRVIVSTYGWLSPIYSLSELGLEAGDEITLSVNILTNAENDRVKLRFDYVKDDGSYIKDTSSEEIWKNGRYSFTGKIPESENVTRIRWRIYPAEAYTGYRVDYAKVALVKGNKGLVDWTPAPEDNIELINSIQTEWTQTFESFESTVSDLDGNVSRHEQTINGIQSTVYDDETGIGSLNTQLANLVQVAVTGDELANSLSVTESNILARTVLDGEVVARINQEAGRTLIENDKLYISANTTYISGTAFMDGAVIKDSSIDSAKISMLDAAQVRVINLDADDITTGSVCGSNMELNLNTGRFISEGTYTEGAVSYDPDGQDTVLTFPTHVEIVDGMIRSANPEQGLGGVYTEIAAGGIYLKRNPGSIIESDIYITGGSIEMSKSNSTGSVSPNGVYMQNFDTGKNTSLTGDGLDFQVGGESGIVRSIEGITEGLRIFPSANATGTNLNTSLHLVGGGIGSYKYIQFSDPSGKDQRIQAVDVHMDLMPASGGLVRLMTYGTSVPGANLQGGSFKTWHPTGNVLTITGDRIETPRDGSRDIYLAPNGTGIVKIGNTAGDYYNIRASTFLNASSRKLKTNITTMHESGLEVINSLAFVEYDLKKNINEGIEDRQVGLIAEDSWVVSSTDGDSIDTYKLMSYTGRAVQELSAKYDDLTFKLFDYDYEIENLKSEVQVLKDEIKQLKGAA